MIFADHYSLDPVGADRYRSELRQIPGAYMEDPQRYPLLFNLAASIHQQFSAEIPIISISGAQGTGKSTLAKLLGELLGRVFDLRSAVVSLDDFYLTRGERQALARKIHPLLATRGVPGTHDVLLMTSALEALKAGRGVEVPVFSKGSDDREGFRFQDAVDIIICEGWCWGASPEPGFRLGNPVNELEAIEDESGAWRHYVNDQLVGYQDLFAADGTVFLKVPSMDAVFRWRWQQEQELRERQVGQAVMDEQGVRGFIATFERLTRWMLESMPDKVDVCVNLDENHSIGGIG